VFDDLDTFKVQLIDARERSKQRVSQRGDGKAEEAEEALKKLKELENINAHLSGLVASRLKEPVRLHLQAVVPPADVMDVWNTFGHLRTRYAPSAQERSHKKNVHVLLARALDMSPTREHLSSSFSRHVRNVIDAYDVMCAAPKIAGAAASAQAQQENKFLLAFLEWQLLYRLLSELQEARSSPGSVNYESVVREYMPQVRSETRADLKAGILERFFKDVQALELDHQSSASASGASRKHSQSSPRRGRGSRRKDGESRQDSAQRRDQHGKSSSASAASSAPRSGKQGVPGQRPAQASGKSSRAAVQSVWHDDADCDSVHDLEQGVNVDCYSGVASSDVPASGGACEPAEDAASVHAAGAGLDTQRKQAFLVDSGATHHCVRARHLFDNFRATEVIVHLADGKQISAAGRGSVRLSVSTDDGGVTTLVLGDALFVPKMSNNILSTNRLTKSSDGHSVSLTADAPALLLGG
jgi:hypothetical protein